MKKEMSGKKIAIAALVIAVIGLSIGFASISTILNIKGTGRVQSSNFDVHFENLSETPEKTATTTLGTTAPTIKNGTEISDFNVTFSKPGDYVTYTFDIVNGGTYDAIISDITIPTPTCTGTGANATVDAKNVCDYLTYTLAYENGTSLAENDTLTTASPSKKVKLTLAYDKNKLVTSDKLPKGAVSISNLDIQVEYSQQ